MTDSNTLEELRKLESDTLKAIIERIESIESKQQDRHDSQILQRRIQFLSTIVGILAVFATTLYVLFRVQTVADTALTLGKDNETSIRVMASQLVAMDKSIAIIQRDVSLLSEKVSEFSTDARLARDSSERNQILLQQLLNKK